MVADLLISFDDLGVSYTPSTFDGGTAGDVVITAFADMQSDIVTDPDGDQVDFNKLGSYRGVEALMDTVVANIEADSRLSGFFTDTDMSGLVNSKAYQASELTGGYVVYSGPTMLEAHKGRCIGTTEFDAFLDVLLDALATHGFEYSPTLDGSMPIDGLLREYLLMEEEVLEACK